MKSIILCLFVVCAFVVNSCYCKCECDPNDHTCISDCVVEANSCVTSCHGNIECYESCIDDKWPAGDNAVGIEELEEQREEVTRNGGIYREVLATTTVYSTISASSYYPSTYTATASASTTAKQADVSHTSFGSSLRSLPATVQLLLAVMTVAMLSLK